MTINKTTTDLSTLKINYLTQEMYEDALENEEINENELYITPGSGSSGSSAFIAEFNVTTLAEAVTEYNAGKTLLCRYTDDVVFYAPLVSVSLLNGSVEGFAFSVGGYGSSISFLLSSTGWNQMQMSATSTPTANKLPLFDANAKMNSTDMTSQEVSDFVGNLGYSFSLIDMFYPVGSYYETSDTSFNPNIAWGGTWVLLPQHDVVRATASSKTLAANSDTEVCTITLDADTKYIILGVAGTGSTSSMTSNCDIICKSGTYYTYYKFVTNAVTASAGSNLNASAYIHTNTSCVIALKKYNYTSSAITTGGGSIVAIPLSGIDETSYRWHRTA